MHRFFLILIFMSTVMFACGAWNMLVGQSRGNVEVKWEDADTEDPSTGYIVKYGLTPFSYSNQIETPTNNISIPNLVFGKDYYFAVSAFHECGWDSPNSEQVSYKLVAEPKDIPLSISKNNGYNISFPVYPGLNYDLEATTNFVNWDVVYSVSSITNTFGSYVENTTTGEKFFRLKVSY